MVVRYLVRPRTSFSGAALPRSLVRVPSGPNGSTPRSPRPRLVEERGRASAALEGRGAHRLGGRYASGSTLPLTRGRPRRCHACGEPRVHTPQSTSRLGDDDTVGGMIEHDIEQRRMFFRLVTTVSDHSRGRRTVSIRHLHRAAHVPPLISYVRRSWRSSDAERSRTP